MNKVINTKLRTIRWKDLTTLNRWEIFVENSVSLPWITLSLVFAWYELYFLALPCSFMFFLTALRLVHNGYHYTLGISKIMTRLTLLANSVLMITSLHAVKFNHLMHHKHCMDEEDVEGKCARMPAWKALLYGPVFIFENHWTALKFETWINKMIILVELAFVALFISLVFLFNITFLKYHVIVMILGEFCTGFFAVWTVHHDCDEEVYARTARGPWKNFFTYNMFYHMEHHLFPAVPTIKLPLLAERIDQVLPEFKEKTVF
jgi:fatty acid desaturase